MHFHYHLQREELLVVLRGTVAVRTAGGWEEVPEGEVRAFPRGERGVHGYENRTDETARLLMFSEQNAPNVSVYPDANQVGTPEVAICYTRSNSAAFGIRQRDRHTRQNAALLIGDDTGHDSVGNLRQGRNGHSRQQHQL